MTRSPATIGLLGLGVMGRSLALNFERHGYRVSAYDPMPKIPTGFPVGVSGSIAELAAGLPLPRIILIMVPAGEAVETAIAALLPFLSEGDILIDGGNSHFTDSERRMRSLGEKGVHFMGLGVSGGESGALWGPSLMAGGSDVAWVRMRSILQSIAAKAPDGRACAAWMGKGGAGHYVKMVHNGVEYADIQLIAETYDFLRRGLRIPTGEIAEIFARWNEGELESYLIEITAQILRQVDDQSGLPLVDLILDEAAQKGTGKWMSQNALELGVPIPTIQAALESRFLSARQADRKLASKILGGEIAEFHGDRERAVGCVGEALLTSKISSYAQGFGLMHTASARYGYHFDFAEIARVWRAGCIIRAGLLEEMTAAFTRNPGLPNLLLDETFRELVTARQPAWRETLRTAIGMGIPMPATGASLAYFDGYRSERLPANLIQAQRDFFGAHTYRRVDREGVFHTQWE